MTELMNRLIKADSTKMVIEFDLRNAESQSWKIILV